MEGPGVEVLVAHRDVEPGADVRDDVHGLDAAEVALLLAHDGRSELSLLGEEFLDDLCEREVRLLEAELGDHIPECDLAPLAQALLLLLKLPLSPVQNFIDLPQVVDGRLVLGLHVLLLDWEVLPLDQVLKLLLDLCLPRVLVSSVLFELFRNLVLVFQQHHVGLIFCAELLVYGDVGDRRVLLPRKKIQKIK